MPPIDTQPPLITKGLDRLGMCSWPSDARLVLNDPPTAVSVDQRFLPSCVIRAHCIRIDGGDVTNRELTPRNRFGIFLVAFFQVIHS